MTMMELSPYCLLGKICMKTQCTWEQFTKFTARVRVGVSKVKAVGCGKAGMVIG